MSKKNFKLYKISYNISEHDLDYKKKNISKHLEKGIPVKVIMTLKGREKYIYEESLTKLKNMFNEFKIINSWEKQNNYYLFLQ